LFVQLGDFVSLLCFSLHFSFDYNPAVIHNQNDVSGGDTSAGMRDT
jgi:hypothetical protein